MVSDQNRTSTMGTSILSRFIECSTQFPDNPAIFVDDRSYTYGELNGLCSAMCALLKAHDITKGRPGRDFDGKQCLYLRLSSRNFVLRRLLCAAEL